MTLFFSLVRVGWFHPLFKGTYPDDDNLIPLDPIVYGGFEWRSKTRYRERKGRKDAEVPRFGCIFCKDRHFDVMLSSFTSLRTTYSVGL
jgi:hypothetical protein